MGNRAKGYKRMEITIAIDAVGESEIWRCDNCGRWHKFDDGAADDYPSWCDLCWALHQVQKKRQAQVKKK
jgi:hypothetical protein